MVIGRQYPDLRRMPFDASTGSALRANENRRAFRSITTKPSSPWGLNLPKRRGSYHPTPFALSAEPVEASKSHTTQTPFALSPSKGHTTQPRSPCPYRITAVLRCIRFNQTQNSASCKNHNPSRYRRKTQSSAAAKIPEWIYQSRHIASRYR